MTGYLSTNAAFSNINLQLSEIKMANSDVTINIAELHSMMKKFDSILKYINDTFPEIYTDMILKGIL